MAKMWKVGNLTTEQFIEKFTSEHGSIITSVDYFSQRNQIKSELLRCKVIPYKFNSVGFVDEWLNNIMVSFDRIKKVKVKNQKMRYGKSITTVEVLFEEEEGIKEGITIWL